MLLPPAPPGAFSRAVTRRLAPCAVSLNQRLRGPGAPAVIRHFSKPLFVGVSLVKGKLIRLLPASICSRGKRDGRARGERAGFPSGKQISLLEG